MVKLLFWASEALLDLPIFVFSNRFEAAIPTISGTLSALRDTKTLKPWKIVSCNLKESLSLKTTAVNKSSLRKSVKVNPI